MAPPPESQLLWINKDVKSYQQSKKLSAAQAAIINAHSQRQARAARAIANQRGLRDSSAVKAILGWKQLGVSSTSRSSPTKDQSLEEFESCLTEESERNPKKLEFIDFIVASRFKAPLDNLLPFIPCICGKDEALDPFNCTPAKIDSTMHKLMEFYLARVHPSSWSARPAGAHESPDIESVEALTECMGDKARFFSLMACTAAYRENLEQEDQKGRGAIYLGQALVAVREQVQRKDFVKNDSLHSIVNMAICAELLGDYAASLAHLRAIKFVVDQGGGLVTLLDPSRMAIFKLIIRADLGLAIKTLSCPVFACPWPPATVPLPQDELDAHLEQLACSALVAAAQVTLPKDLHKYVYHIIECTRMLGYVWSYPSEPEAAVKQLGGSLTAIFYHLLSLSFEEHSADQKKLEATRVSLTIWTWMLSQSLSNDSRVSKDHIPVFSLASLNAKKQFWPSIVFFLLKDWNRVVQSLQYKPNTTDGYNSVRLIRIARAIEQETDVKLGGLMERLFELELWHRTRAKSGINSDQRYQVQRTRLADVPRNPSPEEPSPLKGHLA